MTAYGPPGYQQPQAPSPPIQPSQIANVLAYVAVGLGVISAIWGFLDWWAGSGEGLSGYSFGNAYLVISLLLLAGFLAMFPVFLPRDESMAVLAVAVSLIGVFMALMAVSVEPAIIKAVNGNGSNVGRSIGLVLTLITAILQFVVILGGWLISTGKLMGASKPPPGYGGYGPQGAPQQYGSPLPPQQFGPSQGPQQGPPPGYAPPGQPPQAPPPQPSPQQMPRGPQNPSDPPPGR